MAGTIRTDPLFCYRMGTSHPSLPEGSATESSSATTSATSAPSAVQAVSVQAIQAARDAEFSAIALPLLPTITRIARALARDDADGDDLVQETYLRAYRYWHTFDQQTDCRLWLSAICRNALHDMRRRTRHEDAVEDAELESLAAAQVHKAARAVGLEDMYDRLDLGPAIVKAIGKLDPIFGEIVVLSDIEGLSYDEIAVAVDVPIGTVRSRLYRARRQLQEALMVYALDAGYRNV
jgi:RNA polymerase sigma-70 factor (ECF subfamily)